jgi:hypothetical protein
VFHVTTKSSLNCCSTSPISFNHSYTNKDCITIYCNFTGLELHVSLLDTEVLSYSNCQLKHDPMLFTSYERQLHLPPYTNKRNLKKKKSASQCDHSHHKIKISKPIHQILVLESYITQASCHRTSTTGTVMSVVKLMSCLNLLDQGFVENNTSITNMQILTSCLRNEKNMNLLCENF